MRQYSIGILIFLSLILTNCESPYENWEEVELYSAIDLLDEAEYEELGQILFHYINDYEYICVGLLRNNKIIFTGSFAADRIGKTEVYASVSKPVTSIIFFQLLEDGTIHSVDDPISDYSEKYADVMPEKYLDTPVTFAHLLTHQSGIPHHDRIWKDGKLDLQFEPGTNTMYSTRGYGVLGDVLCEITEMNYNKLVKNYIGHPVDATSFSANPLFFEAPGGLVYSSITDMAFMANGVLDNTYLTDSTQKDVQWVPYGEDDVGKVGMGWYVNNYGTDSLAVFHAGSNGTPRAFIALRPINKTGVVLLGRRNEAEGSQLFYALSRELIRLL